MGVDVLLVGPMPTPAIAFLTRSLRADAGVVLSASHNPYQDNGIKFFSSDGFKLPDEVEARIEELIMSDEIRHLRPTADLIGKAYRIDDAEGRYIEFAKRSLPKDLDFQGIKLVVDCANGAAYKVAPTVLRELGAAVDVIGNKPDGMNINSGCGAVHPELLQEIVLRQKADIGIALDGDADRAVFVCERGTVIDGDHVMAALGLDLQQNGLLAKHTLVGTVMSNFGLELSMAKAGIKLVRTPVGDRYLLERMLADGYSFGGEQSGHFIFLDHNTTGDGLVSALQMLSLLKRTKKPLSELAQAMTAVPQVLINIQVRQKPVLETIPDVDRAIQECHRRLNGSGRVVIRYSGTEPLLRIMVEGEQSTLVNEIAEDLARVVREHIG
jgi:phosphoglucosamine mutase